MLSIILKANTILGTKIAIPTKTNNNKNLFTPMLFIGINFLREKLIFFNLFNIK